MIGCRNGMADIRDAKMEDKKTGIESKPNNTPAYSVEYVPPKSASETLSEIFGYAQKELAANELKNIICEKPEKVMAEGDDSYSYSMPFIDGKRHISFTYYDYVAEMDSFEEYMHSYRGECIVRVFLKIPLRQGFIYKKAERLLNKDETNNIYYTEYNNGYAKFGLKDSSYLFLLDSSGDYGKVLYKWVSGLLQKFNLMLEQIDKSSDIRQQDFNNLNNYIIHAANLCAENYNLFLPSNNDDSSYFISDDAIEYKVNTRKGEPELYISLDRQGRFCIAAISSRYGLRPDKCKKLANAFWKENNEVGIECNDKISKGVFSIKYCGELPAQTFATGDAQRLSEKILALYKETKEFVDLIKSNPGLRVSDIRHLSR